MKRRLLFIFTISLLIFIAGCFGGSDSDEGPKVVSFEITGETDVFTGDEELYTAKVVYDDGTEATTGFTWESTDTSVATIAEDGTLTAVSGGSVKIKAKHNGNTSELTIIVTEVAAVDIIISGEDTLEMNKTTQFTATVVYNTGEEKTEAINWSVSNPDVATIDENGNLLGVSIGEISISAEFGGIEASHSVTVLLGLVTYTPSKIAIIGDSISFGTNPDLYPPDMQEGDDPEEFGWVHMLVGATKESIFEKDVMDVYDIWPDVNVENFGIYGSKASEWNDMDNLDADLTPVLDYIPDVAVVYLGANDIDEYIDDSVVTEEEYTKMKSDIEGVVIKLREVNPDMKIIMPNYYDLLDGESNYPGLSILLGFYDMANYASITDVTIRGNEIITDIATDYDALVCDIYSEFMSHCYGHLVNDAYDDTEKFVTEVSEFDVHPITAGHEKIYDLVYEKMLHLAGF